VRIICLTNFQEDAPVGLKEMGVEVLSKSIFGSDLVKEIYGDI
jgi:hypothetical protein